MGSTHHWFSVSNDQEIGTKTKSNASTQSRQIFWKENWWESKNRERWFALDPCRTLCALTCRSWSSLHGFRLHGWVEREQHPLQIISVMTSVKCRDVFKHNIVGGEAMARVEKDGSRNALFAGCNAPQTNSAVLSPRGVERAFKFMLTLQEAAVVVASNWCARETWDISVWLCAALQNKSTLIRDLMVDPKI